MARVYKPLDGVRILSFEIAFALPAGTLPLSDLGAEVVRVSPPSGNWFGRFISLTDGVSHGKPCICIDLKKEKGAQIAFDLAMQADVVCNNFRPSVMAQFGLDTASLRRAKPSLIVLQLSGYGTPGPWSNFPAFGPSTEAAGGMNRLLVNDDEVPIRNGSHVFADQLAGRHAALAIAAALVKRRETGRGESIDLSMTECITHLMGELTTLAQLTGEIPKWHGNRDPRFAPQGVYKCRGEDEWVSIAVTTRRAWSNLASQLNDTELRSLRYRSMKRRQSDHDRIDTAVTNWTKLRDKNEVAETLQLLGISATPVRTIRDAALDPQLKARGSLQPVKHKKPILGFSTHPHPPLPWRIVGRKRRTLTEYRNAGEDNKAVLNRWLHVTREDIAELEREEVLLNKGPIQIGDRIPEPLFDSDFAKKLGLPQ